MMFTIGQSMNGKHGLLFIQNKTKQNIKQPFKTMFFFQFQPLSCEEALKRTATPSIHIILEILDRNN